MQWFRGVELNTAKCNDNPTYRRFLLVSFFFVHFLAINLPKEVIKYYKFSRITKKIFIHQLPLWSNRTK